MKPSSISDKNFLKYLESSGLIRIFAEVIGITRVTKKKDLTSHARPCLISGTPAPNIRHGRAYC